MNEYPALKECVEGIGEVRIIEAVREIVQCLEALESRLEAIEEDLKQTQSNWRASREIHKWTGA